MILSTLPRACLIVASNFHSLRLNNSPVHHCLQSMAETARILGVEPIVVTEDPDRASIGDLTGICAVDLHALKKKYQFACALPLSEGNVAIAALLRENHSIPGLDFPRTHAFRDKNIMHAAAVSAGLHVPRIKTFSNQEEFLEAARELGPKMVLKRTDATGCFETQVIEESSLENLRRFYDTYFAISTYRHYSQSCFRLEEYISGAQYHVDTVVQNGTVVFQALGRYLDPPLSICEGKPQGTVTRRHNRTPAEKRILRDCTKLIQHMGMKDGVTHAEFYLTPKGHVVFGEIAARVGGGPIDFLYQRAYGINLHQAFVAATLLPGYQPKIKDGPELGAEMFLARDDFDRIEGFANAFSQNNPFKTLTAWKG